MWKELSWQMMALHLCRMVAMIARFEISWRYSKLSQKATELPVQDNQLSKPVHTAPTVVVFVALAPKSS